MPSWSFVERRQFLKAGLIALGVDLYARRADAAEKAPPSSNTAVIGRREISQGLDAMSYAGDRDPFADGHRAAAVIAAAFYCREQQVDGEAQKTILAMIKERLLPGPLDAARPQEKADPDLIAGLVQDLDAGITGLRRSGHNIIFAEISLKALREVPEAVTPERMKGLRKTIQSFGTTKVERIALDDKATFVDLADEKKFIRFVLEEYLKAMELYLDGKGHHGFAGHVLTVGHALLELHRWGYKETAHKGIEAYWQFVQQARAGADLGGKRKADAPKDSPTPLTKEYWAEQADRKTGAIAGSHLIKYPYSFYALANEVWNDQELKERLLRKLYHLTAVS